MKQKAVKQITEEVIEELSRQSQRNITATAGLGVTGAAVGGIVALYWAAYKTLRAIAKKWEAETDVIKKASIKKRLDKQKIKVAKLKKKTKAIKESLNLNAKEMFEIFNEVRHFDHHDWYGNDKAKKLEAGAKKVVAGGVAGILAYKLYKKLKDKYNKATDPKEKAKLKKLATKAKAKLKK